MAGSIHNLSTDLDHTVESDLAIGTFNGALKRRLIYGQSFDDVPVKQHDGEVFWRARKENAAPKQDPQTPPDNDSIDSGMTASYAKTEKWPARLYRFQGMTKTNVMAAMVNFADTFPRDLEWLAGEAAATIDLQRRRCLNQAYHGGCTNASETDSDSTLSAFDVYDTNGLTFSYVNGVRKAVSGSNTVAVYITNTNDGTVLRQISAVTQGTRVDADDTIPGTITLTADINAIAVGNLVKAVSAPPQLRPNGRTSPAAIQSGDKLDFDTVVDASTYLGLNGIEPHQSTGLYHFLGDRTHFSSLWKNSAFREAYRGQYKSDEWRQGNRIECMGILFDWSHNLAQSNNASGVKVRRALVTGEGIAEQYYYEGEPNYLSKEIGPLFNQIHDPESHITLTIRKPLDANAEVFTTSWKSFTGNAATTDSLKNFGEHIYAHFVRGVGIQTS